MSLTFLNFFNYTDSCFRLISILKKQPTLHAKDAGAQVGGFVIGFETGIENLKFRFVTIRNSGHMTPAYGPQKTLRTVYHALVNKGALAPLLPENIFNVSDDEFYQKPGLFAQWVNNAMGDIN